MRRATPELRPALFERSGNGGPTVWWDGRVVGGRAQRPDGQLVWRVPDDAGVGREAESAMADEAGRGRVPVLRPPPGPGVGLTGCNA